MTEGGRLRDGHGQRLSAEIPHAEASQADRWKPVTLYVVRITARLEVWRVYRRYSKFYDLRLQLQKRFPTYVLPPIPPKKLIGKEDPSFIEQRRQELEEFLSALLRTPAEISLSEEVCLFLEVPEPLRLCLLEAETRVPTLLPVPGEAPKAAGIQGGAPDESRITWLLTQLQNLPNNKVASIRAFQDFVLGYVSKTHATESRLTEANIQLLYLGEGQGGLLDEVGGFVHSEVSSAAALSLLCKLLSHEYCAEAPLFRRVLRGMDASVLARMRLEQHLHRRGGLSSRIDAFQMLRSLDLPSEKVEAILQDDFAISEFRCWLDGSKDWVNFRSLHRSSQNRRPATSSELSCLLARPALSNRQYRKIAEGAFVTVQMCLNSFLFPDETSELSASPGAPSSQDAEVGAAIRPDAFTPAFASVSSPGSKSIELEGALLDEQYVWKKVRCPEPSWVSKYNMCAAYRKMADDQQPDAYVARAAMRLPFPARLVACLLADHSTFIKEALKERANTLSLQTVERLQHIADGHLVAQLHGCTVAEVLQLGTKHEAHSEILDCQVGIPSAPHVTARLWLLNCVRILPDACLDGGDLGEVPTSGAPSYLFACTAVPPVAAPLEEGHSDAGEAEMRRSSSGHLAFTASTASARNSSPLGRISASRLVNLEPCGVLVRGAGESGEQADVRFTALLGTESIKLLSSDMLGEKMLFWRTIENLCFVLESLGPLTAGFNHPLLDQHEMCLNSHGHDMQDSPSPSGPSRASSPESHASVEVELIEEQVEESQHFK